MKNKTTTITLIALLTLSSLGLFSTFLTPAAATKPVDLSTMGPFAMDATPEMLGEEEVAIRKMAAEIGSAAATGAMIISGDPVYQGEEFSIDVADFVEGTYTEQFVVVVDGEHCIILVEAASFEDIIGSDGVDDDGVYHFPNPSGIFGRDEDVILQTQLEYLKDEFDINIYPTMATIYGTVFPRGVGDDAVKIWVLIHNIRDESYWPTPPEEDDPTSYIAGYFSASENSAAMENKNMFHIDTYDWEHRIGDNPDRPYLYEGVFAHEYEHMIHFDIDSDEPSWVDEGLADLAGYFCGYGHSEGHLAYYFAYHFYVSLTFWGGTLEDYGMAYLFQFYLYENFGGAAFTTALVNNSLNGIEGIEDTIEDLTGEFISFDEIFDAWTIANYLDDPTKGTAPLRYGYDDLAIGTINTWGYTIEYALNNQGLAPATVTKGQPFGSPAFYGVVPQPYTAHYFRFAHKKYSMMQFLGLAESGTTAHSLPFEWYSGAEAWSWGSFYRSFTLPMDVETLNFWTWYDIEEDWDYGYVEVSDGAEWYTLEDLNGHTVSTDHNGPQDNPNVPAGQEPTDYFLAGDDRWHAFTGYSGGWVEVSMDLTQFAGETIELHFRLWQDAAFTLQNMYVDDISITANGSSWFTDDVENSYDTWTPNGWDITDGILDNNWGVTFLRSAGVPTERYPDLTPGEIVEGPEFLPKIDWGPWQFITSSWLNPNYHDRTDKNDLVDVFIVSNHAGHILTSYYEFYMTSLAWKFEKHMIRFEYL